MRFGVIDIVNWRDDDSLIFTRLMVSFSRVTVAAGVLLVSVAARLLPVFAASR